MNSLMAKLISVNVGRVCQYDRDGTPATSAIWKTPVKGPVMARGVSLVGDEQANLKSHGGVDQAIYAYAMEDLDWFARELGKPLGPGHFGENLSTGGIDVSNALIGERWKIGEVELEITQARKPCATFAHRMNDKTFPKRFLEARRPGAYFRILKEGVLQSGDGIQVLHRPEHDVTVATAFRIYTTHRGEAARFIDLPGLSARWTRWAKEQTT